MSTVQVARVPSWLYVLTWPLRPLINAHAIRARHNWYFVYQGRHWWNVRFVCRDDSA